jgi:hypothetical protein
VSDLLTKELILALETRVRAFFSTRRKLGQVPVTNQQFDQIRQIVGQYDTLATPRHDLDVDDLRNEAAEKLVGVEHVMFRYLDQQCKDLEHHFGMLCDDGNRLLFTCEPQVQLVREHFEIKMFVWCHICLVEPKEPPPCHTPPTASPESAASPTG